MVCALGSIASVIFWKILTKSILYSRRVLTFFFLHHLVYPIFLHRRWLWPSLTRWRVSVSILFWAGNLICSFVDFHDGSDISSRTSLLSIFNIVPLVGLPNFSQASDLLDLQVPGFRAAHGTIGLVVLVQAIIHIVTQLQHTSLDLHNNLHFWGVVVRLRPLLLCGTTETNVYRQQCRSARSLFWRFSARFITNL